MYPLFKVALQKNASSNLPSMRTKSGLVQQLHLCMYYSVSIYVYLFICDICSRENCKNISPATIRYPNLLRTEQKKFYNAYIHEIVKPHIHTYFLQSYFISI